MDEEKIKDSINYKKILAYLGFVLVFDKGLSINQLNRSEHKLLVEKKNEKKRNDIMNQKWCDFSCDYAKNFDTENMSGACRTEIVLFCEKYKKNVKKNSLCLESKQKNH